MEVVTARKCVQQRAELSGTLDTQCKCYCVLREYYCILRLPLTVPGTISPSARLV